MAGKLGQHINGVLKWNLMHGRVRIGQPARTYIF